MTSAITGTTRGIARAAVRAELAQVAFDLFRRNGFDKVTLDDLASAAGISRSTFLRYFRTKEDAVLGGFDAQGEKLAAALRDRPAALDCLDAAVDHWTASAGCSDLDSLLDSLLDEAFAAGGAAEDQPLPFGPGDTETAGQRAGHAAGDRAAQKAEFAPRIAPGALHLCGCAGPHSLWPLRHGSSLMAPTSTQSVPGGMPVRPGPAEKGPTQWNRGAGPQVVPAPPTAW